MDQIRILSLSRLAKQLSLVRVKFKKKIWTVRKENRLRVVYDPRILLIYKKFKKRNPRIQ